MSLREPDMIAQITTALTPLDNVPPPKETRPDQKEALRTIIEYFDDPNLVLPLSEESMMAEELNDREMMFLSQETILRFYNDTARDSHAGTKKDIVATILRLERTIVWRRTRGMDDVEERAAERAEELDTGCNMTVGFSSTGMPIVYFFPTKNYLPVSKRSAKTAFYFIERAMDLLTNGQDQIYMVFSFGGKRQGPATSVQITKEIITTFAEYYPEVMGRAIIIKIPWFIKGLLNVVWPFIDSHTKSKMRMTSAEKVIRKGEIPASEMLEQCGGTLEIPYEQNQDYLATLLDVALTRREEQHRAWLDLGPPAVGRSERDFRVPQATRSLNSLKPTMTDESFE